MIGDVLLFVVNICLPICLEIFFAKNINRLVDTVYCWVYIYNSRDNQPRKTEMTNTLQNITNAELDSHLEAAQEMVGDIQTQYGSEVALYGDAWPGASHDLHDAYCALNDLQDEWSRRRGFDHRSHVDLWESRQYLINNFGIEPDADPSDDIPF